MVSVIRCRGSERGFTLGKNGNWMDCNDFKQSFSNKKLSFKTGKIRSTWKSKVKLSQCGIKSTVSLLWKFNILIEVAPWLLYSMWWGQWLRSKDDGTLWTLYMRMWLVCVVCDLAEKSWVWNTEKYGSCLLCHLSSQIDHYHKKSISISQKLN